MSVSSDEIQKVSDNRKKAIGYADLISYSAGILGTIVAYWSAFELGLDIFVGLGLLCSLCGFLPLLMRCKSVPLMLAWAIAGAMIVIPLMFMLKVLSVVF